MVNQKVVSPGTSSTIYVALANGEYFALGRGETSFALAASSIIYFLFADASNGNKPTLIPYTSVGDVDWSESVLLGIVTINSDGTMYDDQLPFAHKVNGEWWRNEPSAELDSPLKGKVLSILGDSISTYAGYIPSGNAAFFPRTDYDVDNVNYTWWKKLLDATGMVLGINNSWSGSRVATPPAGRTETPFTDPSRYNNLGTPDIIIVFGGINDEFAQSDPTDPGEFNLSTNGTMDVTKLRQAYQFLVRTLQTTYPNAKIFICSPTFMGGNIFENNSVGMSQYALHDMVRQIADYYGCGFIDLAKCGINVYNYQTYLSDTVHPNRKGMQLIFEKVFGTLNAYFAGKTVV